MANNKSDLIAEARSLTDYDSSLISDSDFGDLVDIGQEEIQAETGVDNQISFFGSDTLQQDRALFWLTCLFAKIKAGEVGASNFSIADLESEPLDDQSNVWMSHFKKRLGAVEDARGFGQTSLSRTDRSYEFG